MDKADLTMAQQVARAAVAFQEQRTGHVPRAATVVRTGDTLVVTMHEALSEAEKALAKSPAGAAQVQEFHRQLFANSVDELRQEIKRITGVAVREAAAEVETSSGTVVHARVVMVQRSGPLRRCTMVSGAWKSAWRVQCHEGRSVSMTNACG